jgi:hypothetical protein
MLRRELIAGLGSAAAWPVAVRAQQPGPPLVGILATGGRAPNPVFEGIGAREEGTMSGKDIYISGLCALDAPTCINASSRRHIDARLL